jgi:hypothetical protein
MSNNESAVLYGLIVERLRDGRLTANVEHIVCHSPDGFECGFDGAGPADLALAVMNALIPPVSPEQEQVQRQLEGDRLAEAQDNPALWTEEIGPGRVRVNRLAVLLHQDFKRDFIVNMPSAGGYVQIDIIRAWIAKHAAELTAKV